MADDLPLLSFANAAAFEAWLAGQPPGAPGAWLRFAKAGAAEPTVSKSDAIDSALAYGWIDGQLGKVDEHFFKTRFTPRKPRSPWSQVNRDRVAALAQAGRMTPAGEEQVALARADGRWDAAYAPASTIETPDDLAAALSRDREAQTLFKELDAANRYAVLYRIQQTKTAARRAAKITDLVAMLARGETIHPRKGRRA